MPRVSKKTLVATARREYSKLNRAYHTVGKKALGKPTKSLVHRDYVALKRARNLAGKKLGKLTGARK